MIHRGPDDAGLWRGTGHEQQHEENVVLAHRRLSVLDVSEAGRQPMVSRDGRHVLVYNGELYNDHQLRRELASRGVSFRSSCDTETLVEALACWGESAIAKLRGMFAFGWLDRSRGVLTLARDPLGIKPLYYSMLAGGVTFASEPRAVLGHPDVPIRPDMVGLSAYLTTIRTTVGSRTMFEGLFCAEPGEMIRFDLGKDPPRVTREVVTPSREIEGELSAGLVREWIEQSVRAHLRTDVHLCSLLSGGLDSTIIACIAQRELGGASAPPLQTFCAGTPGAGDLPDDLSFAGTVAADLGTQHTDAIVTRELFGERWRSLVHRLGVPLSTPNEVAINEVARVMRSRGNVVTLSGEGADELFGGYTRPLEATNDWIRNRTPKDNPAHFALALASWIGVDQKHGVLTEQAWADAQQDQQLLATTEHHFEQIGESVGPVYHPLEPHLRYMRRVNLVGLLQRLDSATMLESIEGRTPFADARVCALAEALPMSAKFDPAREESQAGKVALRDAFAGRLPEVAVRRDKASFPLPFQEWVVDQAADVLGSSVAREFFREEALALVASEPSKHWQLAWPMFNVSLWAERWWG